MSARTVLPVIAVGWPVQTCQKFGPLVLQICSGWGPGRRRSGPWGERNSCCYISALGQFGVRRKWGKSPGGFGDPPYGSAVGRQKMAEFRAFRSDSERMLHLRARTFAPLTQFGDGVPLRGRFTGCACGAGRAGNLVGNRDVRA